MADTQPITASFPWLTIKYRAVYSGVNATIPVPLTDQSGIILTSDSGIVLTTDTATSLGDLYRYV